MKESTGIGSSVKLNTTNNASILPSKYMSYSMRFDQTISSTKYIPFRQIVERSNIGPGSYELNTYKSISLINTFNKKTGLLSNSGKSERDSHQIIKNTPSVGKYNIKRIFPEDDDKDNNHNVTSSFQLPTLLIPETNYTYKSYTRISRPSTSYVFPSSTRSTVSRMQEKAWQVQPIIDNENNNDFNNRDKILYSTAKDDIKTVEKLPRFI